MHDDEPGDEVHDLFAEARLRRPPAGPADLRHARRPIAADDPAADPGVLPAPLHPAVHCGRRRRQSRPRRRGRAGPRGVRRHRAGHRRRRRRPRPGRPPPAVRARPRQLVVRDKDTEQAHVVLGGAGIARDDERRFALGVLNNVLGGGMSSPAVPGDPGAARPGVLGLLLHHPVRRHRAVRRLRRLRARQGGRGARADPGRAGAGSPRRASPRPRWPGARACSRARWCSAWRTPARG